MTNTAINNEVMTRAELDDEMMDLVNGGSWYGDTWKFIKKNKDAFIIAGTAAAGAALCMTGVGAAAGAGMIAGAIGSSVATGGVIGGVTGALGGVVYCGGRDIYNNSRSHIKELESNTDPE